MPKGARAGGDGDRNVLPGWSGRGWRAAAGNACCRARKPTTAAPGRACPPPAPVPAQLPAVLAHVNSENVTKVDFERLLRNIELNNGGPVPADRRDEIYRRVLDELVTYTLLKQEAKARNITATDAEVEAQLTAMRQSGEDRGGVQEGARRAQDDARTAQGRRQVEIAIAKMMSAQVATAAEATDAEVRDFYDKNPDRFKRSETVRASHILMLRRPEGRRGHEEADARRRSTRC